MMNKFIKSLVVVFCLSGLAFAQYNIPVQKIVGADTTIALGEFVDLTLSPIKEKPENLVSVTETWKIFEIVVDKDKRLNLVEKKFREYVDVSGNKGIFFGSGIVDKKLFVVVDVTYLFADKDKADATKIIKVVAKTVTLRSDVILGKEPEPQPPVPVPPLPNPVIPDGKFGLAKFIYDSVNKNVTKDKAQVSKDHAKVYVSVVAAVRAGVIKTPEDVLKEVQKGVNSIESVKLNIAQWSKVGDDVQEKLYSLYKTESKLKSTNDFADAIEELAIGLENIK